MVTDRIIGTSILDEDIEGCVTIKTFCNCVALLLNLFNATSIKSF